MSYWLGEDNPACKSDKHHDFSLVHATGNVVPKGYGQGLHDGSNATKEAGLSSVHTNLLEVDAHQREQGTKGSVEKEVKQVGVG